MKNFIEMLEKNVRNKELVIYEKMVEKMPLDIAADCSNEFYEYASNVWEKFIYRVSGVKSETQVEIIYPENGEINLPDQDDSDDICVMMREKLMALCCEKREEKRGSFKIYIIKLSEEAIKLLIDTAESI